MYHLFIRLEVKPELVLKETQTFLTCFQTIKVDPCVKVSGSVKSWSPQDTAQTIITSSHITKDEWKNFWKLHQIPDRKYSTWIPSLKQLLPVREEELIWAAIWQVKTHLINAGPRGNILRQIKRLITGVHVTSWLVSSHVCAKLKAKTWWTCAGQAGARKTPTSVIPAQLTRWNSASSCWPSRTDYPIHSVLYTDTPTLFWFCGTEPFDVCSRCFYANFQTNLNENTGVTEERRCSKLKYRVVCFFTLSSLNARTLSSPAPGSINRLGETRELHKYSSTHIKVQ